MEREESHLTSRIYARVNKGGEEEGREYKKVQHSHVDCGKDWNDQSEARIVDAKYISDPVGIIMGCKIMMLVCM